MKLIDPTTQKHHSIYTDQIVHPYLHTYIHISNKYPIFIFKTKNSKLQNSYIMKKKKEDLKL